MHALDLAAEVGVAGRVDDVDLDALVDDRGVLGHDGDAALALQVVGVHHALGDLLVVAEDVALAEHAVDQGRLAVVDVGDDRDVAISSLRIFFLLRFVFRFLRADAANHIIISDFLILPYFIFRISSSIFNLLLAVTHGMWYNEFGNNWQAAFVSRTLASNSLPGSCAKTLGNTPLASLRLDNSR